MPDRQEMIAEACFEVMRPGFGTWFSVIGEQVEFKTGLLSGADLVVGLKTALDRIDAERPKYFPGGRWR